MLTLTAHGRIGRDTELRYTTEGTAVAEIALACDYGRKGQDGKRPTQWVRASVWGKQAEALAPYLLKGKGLVCVIEDAHLREYQTKDGGKGSALEGRVAMLEFTGTGPREDAPAPATAPKTHGQMREQARGRSDDDGDVPF
jgi:single-strand DNA-binding protein